MDVTTPVVERLRPSWRTRQQAIPRATNAAPATRPTAKPPGVSSGTPNKIDTGNAGDASSAKPTVASSTAIRVSSAFMGVYLIQVLLGPRHSKLERSASQENASECNAANQYDKDRHPKRDGPDVPFPGGSQLIEGKAMLRSRCHQSQGAERDQRHCQIARRLWTSHISSRKFCRQVLEKLVNGEAETDHRKRCSDPCHERSLRSDDRSVKGEIGSFFG
jgi:hypothetical protein